MAMQREPKVKPAPLFDPRGDYYNADVVVALKHLPLVHSVLEENEVLHDVVDDSDLLGLALVRLTDRRAAAEQIIVPLEEAQKKEAREGRTYLDRFLRGLRLRFRQDYAGWTPIVGKNRLVGHVTGGGKISHGGNEPPEVVRDFAPAPREGRSGEGVRVGVLDTSMSRNEWLLGGWTADPDDVLDAGGKVRAVAGHATFVTGLVLRQAPACQVLVRKVLTDDYGEAESWSVARAIVEVGRAGVDVLNLSLVCYTEDGEPPLVLATALDRLPRETVVVAAAGNHGDWTPGKDDLQPLDAEEDQALPDDDEQPAQEIVGQAAREQEEEAARRRREPAFPAALDAVVAVGAAHDGPQPAEFTPRKAPWIDVLAPGRDVVSTYLEGVVDVSTKDLRREPDEAARQKLEVPREFFGYARWSGSSFTAALVSGAIAAGTIPGTVSARGAWQRLREQAAASDPPFLDLRGFDAPGNAASAE